MHEDGYAIKAVLGILACALIVRILALPLLNRFQRAIRQRESAAFTGTDDGGNWTNALFDRGLVLACALVLTALLPNIDAPVDVRTLATAPWPSSPLNVGGWIFEMKERDGLDLALYQQEAGAALLCMVLVLVFWTLTQRKLLTVGMPAGLWHSPRTRTRIMGGFVLWLLLMVTVMPIGVTVAAAVFQIVAFVVASRHQPLATAAVPPAFAAPSPTRHGPSVAAAPSAPPRTGLPSQELLHAFPPLQPHEPQVIGAYHLLGRIGAGGMGTVYAARRAGSATQVALKTINPELLDNADLLTRFEREAEVLSMVSGAYTARVLDSGVDAGRPFLAMELLDGHPLDAHLREQGPIRAPQALRALALALATALGGIHRLGLVHRDLKPGNIMLTSDGPRLLDFGIAAIVDRTRLTRTGGSPGTLTYMAPEQFDEAQPGPASDIWAWACCVVAAVHGESPFAATSIGAVYRKITETGPEPAALAALRAIDPALAAVVLQALNTQPADRPADGTALLTLLTHGPGNTVPNPRSVHEEITQGWQALT
ncbi:serine/threonine protein kinase [Streptomyces griseus]|uniref:serine/threonine-protein kinase n=1 Tax=Streptomyces griseus TaxID=1911 RepID=UPI00386ADA00|nr:serine/threonine protein kinase [Streptomyces fimicarius]